MSEADTRKIIHVDVDAFYASVEQRIPPCGAAPVSRADDHAEIVINRRHRHDDRNWD